MGGAPRHGIGGVVNEVEQISFGPVQLEVLRCESGRRGRSPLLLMHGINNISPEAPFLALLA